MPRLSKGSTIGNYRIEEQIGRGGMGVVYAATHLGLDRRVALKLIAEDLSEDEGFRERFRREPQIAASIDHENVIPVMDAGESQGQLYVTMRLVEGDDLGTILKREGPLDPDRAAGIVSQVAAALDAAHDRGLVHRDVKPANVLIEERGGREHAYLTDFGITKAGGGSIALTRTGDWVGTADYVAPEQIEGKEIDPRTDIYALGAVLYHALAGEAPYARDSEVAKIYAHLSKPIPPLGEKRKDVPPELEATIRRAMAKKPKDRYDSAGELGREAVAAANGDGGLSKATMKLVGAGGAVEAPPEPEPAQPAGETVFSSEKRPAAQTAAPKPKRRLMKPRAPKPKRKAKPEPAAAAKPAGGETKLGKPEPKAPAPARKAPKAPPKAKPARTARPGRSPNRGALVAAGAVGVLALGVVGFVIGSSGGGSSSSLSADSGGGTPVSSGSSSGSSGSVAPTGNPAYAKAVNSAVGRVNSASKAKLKAASSADTSTEQAGPLGDLADVYKSEGASLRKHGKGPGIKAANAAIASAMGRVGSGYEKMASSAASGDEDGYDAGKRAVRSGQRALNRSLARLGSFGYTVSD
jgi:serine/threonine-protein kinase